MGMFSEIHASHEAAFLKGVLFKALEIGNKDIINFCKEYIYEYYLDVLSEAFEPEDIELKKGFSGVKDDI